MMIKSVITALFILMSCCLSGAPGAMLNIVPVPVKSEVRAGSFRITDKCAIRLSEDNEQMRNAVQFFTDLLRTSAGIDLKVDTRRGNIVCIIDSSVANKEGYTLDIKPARIEIRASAPIGVFYAFQTLRQMLPAQIESSVRVAEPVDWSVACARIEDAPRFGYRGMMLDAGRHFIDKQDVLRYIDLMAMHKINTFHWHLTEDQGWRIEIKKYPKLTQVGGYRNITLKNHLRDSVHLWDMTRKGGFYTQDDVREVVAYAKRRFINVIPEIEMPGHALAALAAYSEYSCSGGPHDVGSKWGVFNDIFCSREETFTFVQDILEEVVTLFPGQYVHIGGDEAPKVRWERCYACQQRIKSEGLKDEAQLQTYFMKRVGQFLNSKGKTMIGWDEMIEGGIPEGAVVMSWRADKWGHEAARRGHEVILSPDEFFYLSHLQGPREKEPLGPRTILPLNKVYNYQPADKFTPSEAAMIKGVQGNVWTEYITNPQHLDYMVFPRAAAMAETAWSARENRNFENFYLRLQSLLKHYDNLKLNYSKSYERDK